jgi:hypothetical protein
MEVINQNHREQHQQPSTAPPGKPSETKGSSETLIVFLFASTCCRAKVNPRRHNTPQNATFLQNEFTLNALRVSAVSNRCLAVHPHVRGIHSFQWSFVVRQCLVPLNYDGNDGNI